MTSSRAPVGVCASPGQTRPATNLGLLHHWKRACTRAGAEHDNVGCSAEEESQVWLTMAPGAGLLRDRFHTHGSKQPCAGPGAGPETTRSSPNPPVTTSQADFKGLTFPVIFWISFR